jgi:hypothetical protein
MPADAHDTELMPLCVCRNDGPSLFVNVLKPQICAVGMMHLVRLPT